MDPVGVADQYVGPATRSTERALGHGQVVAHDLELGDAGLREVDLARVGDRNLAAGDVDHDAFALARHLTSIRRPLDTFPPRQDRDRPFRDRRAPSESRRASSERVEGRGDPRDRTHSAYTFAFRRCY